MGKLCPSTALPALILFLILVALCRSAAADVTPSGIRNSEATAEGLIIDSIIIDNRNIYNMENSSTASFTFRLANKLHRVTRTSVIRRELLFAPGDRFSNEVAEETARNLRTRLAFNDAWIETLPATDGRVIVRVVTRDQWSLLGSFRIDRDGNETDIQLGLEDRNFLGYNQTLASDYFVQDNDENYWRWRYSDPRFRGMPLHVSAYYDDNPTDENRSITISHPFYNLYQNLSVTFHVSETGGRRDLYQDSVKIAQWCDRADATSGAINYRWGKYRTKLQLGLQYDYFYEAASDRDTVVLEEAERIVFPFDSLYHQVQLSVAWKNLDFIVVKRLNGFFFSEDITLERSVEVKYARAFTADFDDHHYDRLTFVGRYTHQLGSRVVQIDLSRSYWLSGGRHLRRTSGFVASVFDNGLPFMTAVLRGIYQSDWRANGSISLNLGGKSGLRGFDTNYTSGNRLLLLNLEGRFFLGLEILSVLVGGVAFIDIGRTWDIEEPMTVKNLSRSVGIGLRLSMERYTKTELVRIDLACRQDNTWQFSFGSGQYF